MQTNTIFPVPKGYQWKSQMLENFYKAIDNMWMCTSGLSNNLLTEYQDNAFDVLQDAAHMLIHQFNGKFFYEQISSYLTAHKNIDLDDRGLVPNSHIGLIYLLLSLDNRICIPQQ